MVKFDPLLVNAKESSVAPSVSADVEPTASDDLQHFESSLAALPHTGYKAQQPQPQQSSRPKVSELDRRPKKKSIKAEDNAHNKSWDSDQSLQVVNNATGLHLLLLLQIMAVCMSHAELNAHVHVQMEFELPLQLKQVLLDEYDGIAGHNELPALPRKPCVADILSQYVDQSNSDGLAFEVEVKVPATF